MRLKQWLVLTLVLVGIALSAALVVRASPPGQRPAPQDNVHAQDTPGTGFTYQGQINSTGDPVSGNCDMSFWLFDQESGGSQVGSAITVTVPVSDGLFTVQLDFGTNAFTGDPRWLELAVRCPAGSGDYDILSPRQALSPTPYAIYATHAMTATTASGVEAGVIVPTDLNGITGNGRSGQVLASDGRGGFDWQTTTVNQVVHDFVVASGDSVSAGDIVSFVNGRIYGPSDEWASESVFHAANTWYIAVSALSATDFVVAYADADNSDYGTVRVGTISGGSVSWGAESVFNAAETYPVAVSALSATDFVVVYRDGGNSDYGTARVGTVSGGSVSWGTESVFNAAATTAYPIAVSALSTTDFVVAYQDEGNSYRGTVRVGTVSGGNVSWGTASVFNSYETQWIAVSALSTTEFVVAYRNMGTGLGSWARVGTASGGNVTWESASPFGSNVEWIAVSSLSATSFVIAYRDTDNLNYGTAIVGTMSGATLSWGSPSVFCDADTLYIAVSTLSPTEFVVAHRGLTRVGTVSGGGILSWRTASVFNADTTNFSAMSSLSSSDFVVAYQDAGNAFYGTARVGNYYRGRTIGTAKSTASGGETVTVILSGVSDVHSSLVPGRIYYVQADGSLGIAPTDYRVGLAISATELILDQLW